MHQHESVGAPGRPHPSQGPREARACNLLAKFQSFQPVALLLLAAAFLLAACEPVGSSLGPPKKTEAEALQALETETENLENAINAEIDARKAYVQAVPAGQTVEIVWRLLRRIVVLGQTPPKSLAELLQEWRAAKKAVEEVQKKIETLITALENDYGAAAKQTAAKAKANVTAVTDAVKEVRQAKSVGAINTAENKVKTAVTAAKEQVKNAKEAAQTAGSFSRGDLIYYVAEGTGLVFYKLTAGGPAKLGKALPTVFYSFNGLKNYRVALLYPKSRGDNFRIYVRRKGGGPETLVKTYKNLGSGSFIWIYANGYVYYSVPFEKNGLHSPTFWRFNPEAPTTTSKKLEVPGADNFAADASGNILAISQDYAKFFKKADKTKTGIESKINNQSINFSGADYEPVALNGKIYLLQLKSGSVKAFSVDQNGNATQVIASVSTPVSGNRLRIYNVGASTVFATVKDDTKTRHVLRFDGSNLSRG